MSGKINTKQIIEYVKEELSDLFEQNILSPGMYEKKNNFRLIMRAINQADRDICLYEKYEDTVAIFIPSGQTTIFFEQQEIRMGEFLDEYDSTDIEDDIQFSYLINDTSFLDVISVAEAEGYVYNSIPLQGEKTHQTIEKGTLNDIYSARDRYATLDKAITEGGYDDRYKTYFTVHPSQRKMLLSQPFDSDKWVLFKAKIAPQELDVLDMDKDRLEDYDIMCPYYAKAWLVLKTLKELLPFTTASEAGLLNEEANQQQRTRKLKPGTGNVVISGDEYDSGYEDEFNDI